MNSEDILIYFIIGAMIFLIILFMVSNAISNASYKTRYCSSLDEKYSEIGQVSTIDPDSVEYKTFYLRDYYIKTAYNCCALGDFKNTYVSTCILKNIIKQGVRCLDFEIYSVNDRPVIAVSSDPSFYIKEAYNSLKFDSVISIIRDYCFSGGNCPNPNDPLILHFRIKSNNTRIYNEMTDNIKKLLQPTGRLLGRDYSYENYGVNLGKTYIRDLMGKIIIIVDKTNTSFEGTQFEEFINGASNSVFMRSLRYKDMAFTHDVNSVIEYNKKHMTIVLPDVSSKNDNPKPGLLMKMGAQCVGMSFQNFDSNLEYYDLYFSQAGYAFVLKPPRLRYIKETMDKPDPPPEEYSYKTRNIKSSYYDFNI